MTHNDIPVPTGPNYPGAGSLVRFRIALAGQPVTVSPLDNNTFDPLASAAVARVVGFMVAGREYPLLSERTVDCWVRESRPGFFKIDLDETTIVCAAAPEHYPRIFQALFNTYVLRTAPETGGMLFVPVVKAGLFEDIAYYVEAFHTPKVMLPEFVYDSIRLCKFMVLSHTSPFDIKDRPAYLVRLTRGEDEHHIFSFEPYLGTLLRELPDEQARQFTLDLGHELAQMAETITEREPPARQGRDLLAGIKKLFQL